MYDFLSKLFQDLQALDTDTMLYFVVGIGFIVVLRLGTRINPEKPHTPFVVGVALTTVALGFIVLMLRS